MNEYAYRLGQIRGMMISAIHLDYSKDRIIQELDNIFKEHDKTLEGGDNNGTIQVKW